MRFIILFAFCLCVGFRNANSLRCYVCENCEDVSEEDLQSCPFEVITTVAPEASTLDPEASTVDPEASTVDPEASTVDPEISTVDPEASTVDPEASTVDPEASTVDPEASTVDPEASTVDPEASTVDPEASTVDPEASTVDPEASTVDPEASTVDPEASTVDPEASTVDPEASTVDPEGTTESDNVPGEPETEPEEGNQRAKRHITKTKPFIKNDGCYCINEDDCDCSYKLSQRDEVFVADYVCFKAYVRLSNLTTETTVFRGCLPSQLEGKPLCEYANDANPDVIGCITCNTDRCNSAISIRESIFLIIISIIAMYFK